MQEIEWTYYDADFRPGVYDKGRVTKPNVQVTSLTSYYNQTNQVGEYLDYRTMYWRLTEDLRQWTNAPGRRSKIRRLFQEERPTIHGHRLPAEFYRQWIETNVPTAHWIATSWIGATGQFNLSQGAFDGERAVLARISSDELVPVFSGKAYYPWDPNHRGLRKVYGYWTTT